MVTIYHDLDYEDFYKLVADMDLVIPAFADFGCESHVSSVVFAYNVSIFEDFEDQASSTMALAVELNVSLNILLLDAVMF